MTIMLREVLKELVYIPDNLLGIICDFLKKLNADKTGEFLKQFKLFLRGELFKIVPNILKIDRSHPFDIKKFLGEGSSTVEEDSCSIKITELDFTKVQLKDMLKDGETSIYNGEKRRRLKGAGYILLDAKIFQTLWESKERIPDSWKELVNGNTRYILFDGSDLNSSDNHRCNVSLYWRGDNWSWRYTWSDKWSGDYELSAVLVT